MANGYVSPQFRPPPGLLRGLNRLPFPPAPAPADDDPTSLFARPGPAFCAFPDNGPNIFQRAGAALKLMLAQCLVAASQNVVGMVEDSKKFVTAGQDMDLLTAILWEGRWSIFIGLACVIVMSLLAWFFAPKGENQTYVRSPPVIISIAR